MKKISLLLLLAFFVGSISFLNANPVVKETTQGNIVKVQLIVDGALELYKYEMETTINDIQNPTMDYIQKKNVYYIGKEEDGKINKITRFNYKRILKEHLSGNPELANKIGTKGYRYGDLEKILNEHNC